MPSATVVPDQFQMRTRRFVPKGLPTIVSGRILRLPRFSFLAPALLVSFLFRRGMFPLDEGYSDDPIGETPIADNPTINAYFAGRPIAPAAQASPGTE